MVSIEQDVEPFDRLGPIAVRLEPTIKNGIYVRGGYISHGQSLALLDTPQEKVTTLTSTTCCRILNSEVEEQGTEEVV